MGFRKFGSLKLPDVASFNKAIATMTVEQLEALDEYLSGDLAYASWSLSAEKLEKQRAKEPKVAKGRVVLKRLRRNGMWLRLEGVRCGKPCKCAAGELHGPYWYAYARIEGRSVSVYLGKKKTGAKVQERLKAHGLQEGGANR